MSPLQLPPPLGPRTLRTIRTPLGGQVLQQQRRESQQLRLHLRPVPPFLGERKLRDIALDSYGKWAIYR